MESKGRIGVIIPHVSSNSETDFIDVIYETAAEYGYDTLVVSGVINYMDEMLDTSYCKGQTNIYDLILYGDFDGFIFEANIFCSEKQRKTILDLLKKRGIPTVVVNYEQPYFPVVSADETIQLRMTTEHLIKEHGCRKLYCIGGYKGHTPSEARINGFRQAMDNAGIKYDESCIFYGDYWRDIPRQIAIDIAEGKIEKPDGIVCGSDIMAVSLSRTLIENGVKVPEDIKVTGCDGSIISQTERVTITTVSSQSKLNAMLAVRNLLGIIGEKVTDNSFPLELVIGESCGCAENGNICRSKSLSDIREYAGNIFEMLEHRRTSSYGEINRRMSECSNIYDVTGTFLGCCYMMPTGIKAELCLCDDWCRDMSNPLIYRRGGYSDKMILGMEADYNGCNQMIEFNIRDIFPSLKKPHSPRLTVLSSIHYKGQIFGYVGFTYRKALHIIFDEFYMTWCDSVSIGLNSVQNRMYKEYVNKRIESLSEFAPVLGIYNRRGLISKLVGLMTENNSSEYLLILVSYIKEGRVRYSVPPVNSIVNAIRLTDKGYILASIDEEIIGAVVRNDERKISSYELAVEITDKVNASYKGAIELKTDRIAVISKVVTSADIFEIDTLISELTDELKGKMMSLSSGMFSYKDRFIALRDDIFRHPEKEWNIEAIIRSMGISKSHFQRIYKELFDTSCKEDIITSRMEKAKWLLENTIIPVTQIAEQCGYFNSSHFIRQFGSRVEMTPSDYRKKFRKE